MRVSMDVVTRFGDYCNYIARYDLTSEKSHYFGAEKA